MATIQNKTDQLRFNGQGPLDSKAIVKTYSELLNPKTWTVNGTLIAYNGMITAVWLDKTVDERGNFFRNGIYYFFDPAVTSITNRKDANVADAKNWHKLGNIDTLPEIEAQLKTLQEELEAVKDDVEELQDSATVVEATKSAFPEIGEPGKIYVATKEARTYVWYNNDYLPVGDGGGDVEIQIIHGGDASGANG